VYSLATVVIVLPLSLVFEPYGVRTIWSAFQANAWFMTFSVVLNVLASFLIIVSIKELNASTASIIEISYPFFVIIFSYFLFKQSLTPVFLLGALLIFAGSFVIIRFS
jgi:drug/metabolite transporter (DMT)-like permease